MGVPVVAVVWGVAGAAKTSRKEKKRLRKPLYATVSLREAGLKLFTSHAAFFPLMPSAPDHIPTSQSVFKCRQNSLARRRLVMRSGLCIA